MSLAPTRAECSFSTFRGVYPKTFEFKNSNASYTTQQDKPSRFGMCHILKSYRVMSWYLCYPSLTTWPALLYSLWVVDDQASKPMKLANYDWHNTTMAKSKSHATLNAQNNEKFKLIIARHCMWTLLRRTITAMAKSCASSWARHMSK